MIKSACLILGLALLQGTPMRAEEHRKKPETSSTTDPADSKANAKENPKTDTKADKKSSKKPKKDGDTTAEAASDRDKK